MDKNFYTYLYPTIIILLLGLLFIEIQELENLSQGLTKFIFIIFLLLLLVINLFMFRLQTNRILTLQNFHKEELEKERQKLIKQEQLFKSQTNAFETNIHQISEKLEAKYESYIQFTNTKLELEDYSFIHILKLILKKEGHEKDGIAVEVFAVLHENALIKKLFSDHNKDKETALMNLKIMGTERSIRALRKFKEMEQDFSLKEKAIIAIENIKRRHDLKA